MLKAFEAVHPATWIVAGCSSLLVALSPVPIAVQALFLLFLWGIFVAAGLARRYLTFAVLGMLPIAFLALLIQTISYQHNSIVWAEFAPFPWLRFMVGPDGVLQGLRLALQILLFGSSFALVSVPTTPEGLRVALHRWHVPSRAIYLLVATMHAPVLLNRTMHTVRESQRMRGLAEATLWQRFRLVIQATGAMINLVLLENEGRTRSLEQRGIDASQRVLLRSFHNSKFQGILRILMPLAALAVVFISFWGELYG